jgi:predicted permease
LLLAGWGTKAGLAVLPGDLPRAHDLGLDPHVLLFTAAISILAAAFFGFVPALKSSRPDLQDTLKEGGRGGSAARHRTLGIFVVTQMALAVVLLIGAGLTVRSLVRLWNVNLGFDPSNILSFNVALPSQTAKQTPEQIRASLVHLRDEIAAIAGVKAAAIDYGARPMRGDNEWPFWIEGRPKPPTQSEMQSALVYVVGPEYAKVMGIPLERGRFLTQQDGAHSLPVAVVDQDFAREQFGNQDPIGQQIDFGFDVMGKAQIVGVVGHINQWGPARDATGPVKMQIYVPAMQMPDQYAPELANDEAIVVRTETPTHASIDSIRNAVARMNNEQVAYDFESMNETVARSIAERRFTMILLSAFAGIALLLASIGIYGVISYITGSRTREIGTRLALGAQRADVLKLVIAQGTKMALIGVAIGAVVALGLTRLMASLLFEVTAHDPVTFAGVALLLLVVALLACYLPARRAAKVDPMTALRYE